MKRLIFALRDETRRGEVEVSGSIMTSQLVNRSACCCVRIERSEQLRREENRTGKRDGLSFSQSKLSENVNSNSILISSNISRS